MTYKSEEVRCESITFFEDIMCDHNAVESVEKISRGLYVLNLKKNKKYKVYLTNLYTIGISDVIEITKDFNVDAIVTMSQWNSYTLDAKKYGLQHEVGVFIFRELMGALNFERPEQYYTELDEYGNKIYEGSRG